MGGWVDGMYLTLVCQWGLGVVITDHAGGPDRTNPRPQVWASASWSRAIANGNNAPCTTKIDGRLTTVCKNKSS